MQGDDPCKQCAARGEWTQAKDMFTRSLNAVSSTIWKRGTLTTSTCQLHSRQLSPHSIRIAISMTVAAARGRQRRRRQRDNKRQHQKTTATFFFSFLFFLPQCCSYHKVSSGSSSVSFNPRQQHRRVFHASPLSCSCADFSLADASIAKNSAKTLLNTRTTLPRWREYCLSRTLLRRV